MDQQPQRTSAVRAPRSRCPINLALELLGDRWSLLVIRDLMFTDKRHFNEFLRSDEGISTNILAERLHRLLDAGLLTRTDDPDHRQKAVYRLTEAGIDLLPVVAALGIWGRTYLPVTPQSGAQAAVLAAGGPRHLAELRDQLRATHLT